MIKTVYVIFVWASLVSAGYAQGVHVNNSAGFFAAMERGDVASVRRFERDHHANVVLVQMNRAYLRYDIARTVKLAKQCELSALQHKAAVTALLCNNVSRDSELLLGNAHAYLSQSLWARAALYPAVARKLHKSVNFGTGNGLNISPLHQLVAATPAVTEAWRSASEAVVLKNAAIIGKLQVPVIPVVVNGHEMFAIVGRGAGLATPISIIEPTAGGSSLAQELGLTLLVKGYEVINDNLRRRSGSVLHGDMSADLYLMHVISVGPLVLHNVAVAVYRLPADVPVNSAGIYLHWSLLRRFGEITISRNRILFSKIASNQCRDSVPMVYAPQVYPASSGAGRLLFPASFDHQAVSATFALRARPLFSVAPNVFRSAMHGYGDGFGYGLGPSRQPITVKVGDQRLRAQSADIPAVWHEPFQLAIGGRVLDAYAVHLQFGGASPTICFANDRPDATASK